MEDPSDARLDLKSRVADLLEHTFPSDNFRYADEIPSLLDSRTLKLKRRFVFDIDRVQSFDATLWQNLLSDPTTTLPAFEQAVLDHARDFQRYPDVAKALEEEPVLAVGFSGEFGSHLLSPRQLSADRMNQLVCLVGIVTKASTVRPKVVRSVHYCEESKRYTVQEYRDVTSNLGLPTGGSYPTKEKDTGYLLETEYGLCKYVNSQMVSIQELPELAPPGLLPRSFDVILENDLVDQCKPGDRIYASGIYKALVPRGQYQMSGTFRGVLVANHIKHVHVDLREDITVEEIKQIKKIAQSRKALDQLSKSLAPTIFGHEVIKKGLILLLLGGCETNLESGTHLRGDINCLLVGDPGTAKSQLLRAVMSVCPLAISTTGRGSTGVGLTAAVVSDPDSGDKRLEAGAMVLADRGVACIDEFDKMDDMDRVAIHEVMEQQTVTIAKAGIHVALNARCSVLAAANPIYGNYDDSISINRNVNLPDSLLSRFDMLFIVLDDQDADRDREIGAFVLDWHQQETTGVEARPMLENVHSWYMEQTMEESSRNIELAQTQGGNSIQTSSGTLSPQFLQKYVMYAKRRASEGIELTDSACKAITDYYVEVRSASERKSLPVTPRTLESVIRLASAHAKLRLSRRVDARDVRQAMEIMNVVLRNEPELKQRPRHSQIPAYGNIVREGDEDDLEDGMDMDTPQTETQGELTEGGDNLTAGASGTTQQHTDAMEVDAGPEGLTDAQKSSVIDAISNCVMKGAIVKFSELQARLEEKGASLPTHLVEEYLYWITEHYEEQPGVLPQIMYDRGRKELYDLLQ